VLLLLVSACCVSGMEVESLSLVIFSLFSGYIPHALNPLIALTLENACLSTLL